MLLEYGGHSRMVLVGAGPRLVSGYYGELVVTGDLSRHHSLDFMGCLHGFLPVHCAGVDGRLD